MRVLGDRCRAGLAVGNSTFSFTGVFLHPLHPMATPPQAEELAGTIATYLPPPAKEQSSPLKTRVLSPDPEEHLSPRPAPKGFPHAWPSPRRTFPPTKNF